MHTVKIRLPGEDFSTAIVGMRDWLEKNRFEPTGYRYDQDDDMVVVSVDFAVDAQAEAFAERFGGQTADQRPVTRQPSDTIGASGPLGALIRHQDLRVGDVRLGGDPHQSLRDRD